MPIDFSSIPISGGVLVAGALWAGASAYALGPLVAERSAEQIGWTADCEQRIAADIKTRQPAPEPGFAFQCGDLLGGLPGEQRQFLDMFGMGIACDAMDRAQARKRHLAELKRQRIERAAAEAGSRCACAVSHMTMVKRWDFALAAGTARTVVPSSVTNLRASLLESLASPACAGVAKLED
ncbi:hypothetical protein [Jiella marina]|uniref:hypothetical protein n=1 Tax=Jiella sp. LLJ827 TaxID=2917712 RepID=UPI0021015CB4|nr:hypothetical protein [Jiella sp. LLJ827]MCQ0989585.1 hypothetical protein [Jiella sp. LLJ827]